MRQFLLFAAAAIAPVLSVTAQHPHSPVGQAPATDSLGTVAFANSGNAAAQAPFLRGVKLLHNFQYPGAVRAFQEAQRADPGFALAYWGEAMAHNYTLWAEQHTDEAQAVLRKLGPTPEARGQKAVTDRERSWLAAVEALYGAGTKLERDLVYADRMDALLAAYPDDIEARVFAALATMGRSHGVRDTALYMKAAALLEEVYLARPQHPGVLHYLIHAYDDPTHAPLGLRSARRYDKVAPDSAHALHMTSHIFLAMGMWPETAAANSAAIKRMNQVLAAQNKRSDCGHGPIWLAYARFQMGEDPAEIIEACRAAAFDPVGLAANTSVIGGIEEKVDSWADMAVRRGIETGRWPADVSIPLGHYMYGRFILDYGRVLAARGNATSAAAALRDLRADRDAISGAMPREMPDDRQLLHWLERAIAQAEAVTTLAAGDSSKGLNLLRAAAEAEAALPPVFGPPIVQKPSYELLGDELLAVGDKAAAIEAYRKSLKGQPGRRLSLRGLARASAQ
jgi:tetratricopeptide (TPR) repeat protein